MRRIAFLLRFWEFFLQTENFELIQWFSVVIFLNNSDHLRTYNLLEHCNCLVIKTFFHDLTLMIRFVQNDQTDLLKQLSKLWSLLLVINPILHVSGCFQWGYSKESTLLTDILKLMLQFSFLLFQTLKFIFYSPSFHSNSTVFLIHRPQPSV